MRTYTEGEVLKVLREAFQPRRGQTQEEKARGLGFSEAFIYAVLAKQKPVSKELAQSLGFRRTVVFHKVR